MANIVALVPLRGGSKGIPDKNIRLLAGKPLCAWVLEAACLSGVFSKVVVSTDSPKIADVVRALGLAVDILERPAEYATDTASTESVMLHAASALAFDVLVTIQATSPLVLPDDFRQARDQFATGGFDTLLTAVRTKRFFWRDGGSALNYDPQLRPRRQDFSGSLVENGAFYFTKRSILEQSSCRLGGRIGIYEMAPETMAEIDEPEDWQVVERALRQRERQPLAAALRGLRLLIVDVDGTLTDAGMYWSADGDMLKKFNTRDAKGLQLVRQAGVEVAIMTTENSPIVTARIAKLGIDFCFIGVDDKRARLLELAETLNVGPAEMAFIGDDTNDLECLTLVGFSACPNDAVDAVKSVVHHICTLPGGMGAVREVCEMILEAKK